jgi:co-chaperonin GroES (HSP10)
MYSIKEITGNLLLVSKIEEKEKTVSGLYIPKSKGKYTLCKVIKIGKEVKNESIKENIIVAIPSILLDSASSLDETFNLPKQINIINKKECDKKYRGFKNFQQKCNICFFVFHKILLILFTLFLNKVYFEIAKVMFLFSITHIFIWYFYLN